MSTMSRYLRQFLRQTTGSTSAELMLALPVSACLGLAVQHHAVQQTEGALAGLQAELARIAPVEPAPAEPASLRPGAALPTPVMRLRNSPEGEPVSGGGNEGHSLNSARIPEQIEKPV